MGHAIRAIIDQNPRATVLSIDGIRAFDHVYRSAMMSKLVEVLGLQGLLPFVRTVYAQPSSHVWEDAEGRRQQVWQHEAGEQGDVLMPLLFSLAVHHSLEEVHQQSEPGEELMAFLDDTHVVSEPERTRPILPRSCFKVLESGCMKAKLVCGTEGASAQPTRRIWVQICGVLMASKSWGLHWRALSSRKQQRTHGWKRSVLDP